MSNFVKGFRRTTLGACLTLALATGTMSTVASADTAEEIRAAQATQINLSQALDIANKQGFGTLVAVDFDDDDSDSRSSSSVYELTFVNGSTEQEVKIDANTGEVVSLDADSMDSDDMSEFNTQQRAKISVTGIINSLDQKNGNRILEIEFDGDGDYNDHPQYYEVDLLRGNQIYKIKIDADSGREFERELKD